MKLISLHYFDQMNGCGVDMKEGHKYLLLGLFFLPRALIQEFLHDVCLYLL
jgi:hypothetical protein